MFSLGNVSSSANCARALYGSCESLKTQPYRARSPLFVHDVGSCSVANFQLRGRLVHVHGAVHLAALCDKSVPYACCAVVEMGAGAVKQRATRLDEGIGRENQEEKSSE